MTVPPHLHRKLQEVLGADAAEDLVNMLESMDAWAVILTAIIGIYPQQ